MWLDYLSAQALDTKMGNWVNQEEQFVDSFMVTWKIQREFGGMTTVCLQRAADFAERYGHSSVVTFNADASYPQIIDELISRGKFSAKARHENMYFHLAEHPLPAQAKLADFPTPIPFEKFTVRSEERYLDSDAPFSRLSTAGDSEEATRSEYFRTDGTVFLTDTRFTVDGKKQRQIEVFHPDGAVAARFPTMPALCRYWLTCLADHPDSLVIVDSKYTAQYLNKWKARHAAKLYAFHSIHVTSGEDLQTGSLTTSHAPIIESRETWDGFVFLTKVQRDAYVQRFGETEAEKALVIPNPLKAVVLDEPLPQRNPHHLIIAGSLSANKNVRAAIDVTNLLVQRGLNPVLNIVGDGSQREQLEEYVAELGIGDSVIFHGFSTQVPRLFASSAIQLACSRAEGQAMVLLEAQRQGCIPVAFDIYFGPADAINDGHNGFLIPAGDIETMADRAERILRDQQLAKTMSANCLEFARDYMTQDLVTVWKDAMIFGSRFKRKAKKPKPAPFPKFSADLAGMDFLEGGQLRLKVAHTHELPADGSYDLVVLGRDSKEIYSQIAAESITADTVTFILDPRALESAGNDEKITDVSLRCTIGERQKIKRLGTPASPALPFMTSHNNLSFKRA